MKYILLITVALFFIATGISAQTSTYSCNPETDCDNALPGAKVPDPDDCNQYYLCVTNSVGDLFPTENPTACPTDEFFDIQTGNCQKNNGTTCQDQCLNICNVDCVNPNDFVVYLGNCHKFYQCNSDGTKTEHVCPGDRYFSGKDCDTNEEHCCDNCEPVCQQAFVQIINPNNCSEYYICTSGGRADPTTLSSCGPDEYFDTDLAMCVPYADDQDECKPYCDPSESF